MWENYTEKFQLGSPEWLVKQGQEDCDFEASLDFIDSPQCFQKHVKLSLQHILLHQACAVLRVELSLRV